MPSNPNIALSVKAPQFRSPLETAARAQQIASNAMAMRKAEMETGSVNALREYIKGGGKLDTPEAVTAAISAGASPDTVRMLAQQNFEAGKQSAEIKKAAAAKIFAMLPTVIESGDDQSWVNWLGRFSQLGAEEKADVDELMRQTGGKFNRNIALALAGGAEKYFEKMVPQASTEVIIGEKGVPGVVTRGGFGAPTIRIPKTYEPGTAQGGIVEMGEQTTVQPGVGGPDGSSPAQQLMLNLASVRDDASYQTILSALDRADPQIAQQLRAVAPRFDPAVLSRVVKDANAALGGGAAPAADSLVAGERGGVGGPPEGYVESATPFRARVPAPPVGPQPRETAAEAADKRKAVLAVEREFELNKPPAKPTPLTEAQRLQRRDALAGEYKKAQALLDKTYGKAGIIDAVNAVRNLSRSQKEAITGYSAYAPSVFASSKDADTAVKNLQGTVTELGKEAAAASGAIGSMAVQEWTIVRNMIVNLDLEGMSAEGLDRQLNIIEEKAKNAARLTQEAFAAQYNPDLKTMPEFRLKAPAGAGRAAPKPGSQYPVMTPEQVRKAPPGTKFRRADNGQPMVKQ